MKDYPLFDNEYIDVRKYKCGAFRSDWIMDKPYFSIKVHQRALDREVLEMHGCLDAGLHN